MKALLLATAYLSMVAITRAFHEELYEYDLAINTVHTLTTITIATAHFSNQAYLVSIATVSLLALSRWTKPVALGVLTFFVNPFLGIPLLVTQATRLSTTPQPRLYASTFLLTSIILFF